MIIWTLPLIFVVKVYDENLFDGLVMNFISFEFQNLRWDKQKTKNKKVSLKLFPLTHQLFYVPVLKFGSWFYFILRHMHLSLWDSLRKPNVGLLQELSWRVPLLELHDGKVRNDLHRLNLTILKNCKDQTA